MEYLVEPETLGAGSLADETTVKRAIINRVPAVIYKNRIEKIPCVNESERSNYKGRAVSQERIDVVKTTCRPR